MKVNKDGSFTIKRTKSYLKKPLLLLIFAIVVFVAAQVFLGFEILGMPDAEIYEFVIPVFIYLLITLFSVLLFVAGLIFTVALFTIACSKQLTIKNSEIVYRRFFKSMIIPREKLASVRMAQESASDIKHNRGTLYLRTADDFVINFGRVNEQSKLAYVLRRYVKESGFDAGEFMRAK